MQAEVGRRPRFVTPIGQFVTRADALVPDGRRAARARSDHLGTMRALPVTPRSLLLTAVVGAVAGIASTVVLPGRSARVDAPLALTGTVVLDDEGLSLALKPVVPSQALGDPILLEVTLQNVTEGRLALPTGVTLELAVRHESLPVPLADDGASALLVLDVVLGPEAGALAPGESFVQRVALAPGPPFEAAGRYLVTSAPGSGGTRARQAVRLLLCDPDESPCTAGEA